MQDDEHFRGLERMYHAAPTNRYYAPRLEVWDGGARLRIPVQEAFFHAACAVHGSVYFKALDDAAYFAVNSRVRDVLVLTASFQIHLVRPVTGGTLVAEGRMIHASRRRFLAEATLSDDDGRLLARGDGSYMRSEIPLGAEVGYS